MFKNTLFNENQLILSFPGLRLVGCWSSVFLSNIRDSNVYAKTRPLVKRV